MIIGVPKEIKNNENRVAVTPAGASEFVKHGHTVYVQKTAGLGSGFTDEQRSEIWDNKDKYINKIAEIQYFEESKNQAQQAEKIDKLESDVEEIKNLLKLLVSK